MGPRLHHPHSFSAFDSGGGGGGGGGSLELLTLILLGGLAGTRRAQPLSAFFPLHLKDIALYLRRTPLTDQGLRYNYN